MALAAAGVTPLVAALCVLRVWRGDLDDTWNYNGDALFFRMIVKGVLEYGWHLNNPRLGAPLGQQLYDIPVVPLENASIALIWVIGLFTSDAATVLNVFYLLGFSLTGLSAYLVLRALRLSPGVSAVCAILFALLPYHWIRAQPHVFLATYYTVPASCYLALQVLRGRPLIERRAGAGRGPLAFASKRTLATVALCVLVGSTGGYYIPFTLALIAVATVVAFAAHRSPRVLLTGALVWAMIAVTLAVAFSPSLRYALENGRNPETSRQPTLTDELGLRISLLLLPVREHRLEVVDDLRERVDRSDSTETGSTSLGLVAALGFVALLLAAVTRAVRRPREPDDDRFGAAAAATVILLVLATAGGVVALVRFWVGAELRAWNRVSIFVAFLALLAAGLLLERLRRHRLFQRRPPAAWAGALGLVLVVGALDQTNASFIPAYKRLAAAEASDRAFVEGIEARLPEGAAVFQLPYVPFFEADLADSDQYELLRPYLNSEDLRWSFGSVRGRPGDWFAAMATLPTNYVLPAVTAAGFDGLVVHRGPYGELGIDAEAEVCRILNQRAVSSPNGQLAFLDLRPYREQLRRTHGAAAVAGLGEVTIMPAVLRFEEGFHPPEEAGRSRWAWTNARRARLNLFNPASGVRGVRLSASISAGTDAEARITYPDGSRERLAVSLARPASFYRDLNLRPGNNVVTLEAPSGRTKAAEGDRRVLYLRLNDPVVVDLALLRFVAPIPAYRAVC